MMMNKCAGLIAKIVGLTLVGLGGLGGCAITTPSEESQFFLLSSPAIPSQTFKASDVAEKTVIVGPIHFPDYLKRGSIISQVDAHRHDIAKLDQWGGSLEDEFEIALIKNLLKISPGKPFVSSSGVLPKRQNNQIKIDIYRFGRDSDHTVALEASWVWLNSRGDIVSAGSFRETAASSAGVKAQVSGMSMLVEQFAKQLLAAAP